MSQETTVRQFKPWHWIFMALFALVLFPLVTVDGAGAQNIGETLAPDGGPALKFVRIVLGEQLITFEGKEVNLDAIPDLLKGVADRGRTVLTFAVVSESLSAARLASVRSQVLHLGRELEFKAVREVGVHPLSSYGVNQSLYTERLLNRVATELAKGPNGGRTSVEAAVQAICLDSGIPYRAQLSTHLAGNDRQKTIGPLRVAGATVEKALLNVLHASGLRFNLDAHGLYLYRPEADAAQQQETKIEVIEDPAASLEARLVKPISVSAARNPGGEPLTVQYAMLAICEAVGVPYQWDKSAGAANPERNNTIQPLKLNGIEARKAINDLLTPQGLKYVLDDDGLSLAHIPKKMTPTPTPTPIPQPAGPPQIVSISPEVGARDVDPALKEITVTFDRDMGHGYSWIGDGPILPPSPPGVQPTWRNARTCVRPVQLAAGKFYRVGLNFPGAQNFRSQDGTPAPSTVLYFTTRGAAPAQLAALEVPTIVKLEPANGASGVSPKTTQFRVTFSMAMGPESSWCGGGDTFPEIPQGMKQSWSAEVE